MKITFNSEKNFALDARAGSCTVGNPPTFHYNLTPKGEIVSTYSDWSNESMMRLMLPSLGLELHHYSYDRRHKKKCNDLIITDVTKHGKVLLRLSFTVFHDYFTVDILGANSFMLSHSHSHSGIIYKLVIYKLSRDFRNHLKLDKIQDISYLLIHLQVLSNSTLIQHWNDDLFVICEGKSVYIIKFDRKTHLYSVDQHITLPIPVAPYHVYKLDDENIKLCCMLPSGKFGTRRFLLRQRLPQNDCILMDDADDDLKQTCADDLTAKFLNFDFSNHKLSHAHQVSSLYIPPRTDQVNLYRQELYYILDILGNFRVDISILVFTYLEKRVINCRSL
jgi:hypothetical protein